MVNSFQLLLLIACLFACSAAFGNSDTVRLMPDNSLRVEGRPFALFGIAVPVATAKCFADGISWPCGAAATLRLNELVQRSALNCDPILELDNISLAHCTGERADIAGTLVKEGWALAVSPESDYSDAETHAKNLQLGIWRDGFSPPEDWRQYPDTSLDPYLDLMCSACSVRKR